MSGNITSSTLYSVNMTGLAGGTAGGAEVAAYDATRKLALVLGANGVDFLNVETGARVGGIGKADVGGTGGTPTSLLGTANSVAIHGDKMAVSYDGASAGVNGYVAMFQLNGTGSAATWLYTVTGPSPATFAVPDMVTFTPDGSKLLVALEGEPASNYSVDPFGGVGVINVATGTLQIADLTAFDSQKAALIAAGVRLNAPSDGATPVAGAGLVSKDVEPEYITISSDGTKAYVTLQEANSLAVVDLTGTPTVTAILPFGTKDHSLAGNGMDTSDQDGLSGANANIRTVPVKGLYMPDAIASFEQGGKTYFVTANEGDAREYSANTDVVRLNSKTAGVYNIQLDPTVFGANINNTALEATTIRAAADLGRLNVSRTNGDTDNDGDIDVIHSIGARSFSIWTIEGDALVRTYDSGDLIEQTLKANFPTVLDDGRSDDKGPEPEHVTLGRMNGDLYAFVGLERATAGNSTIMSFRIDGPTTATYTGTIISTGTGAQAPEAFTFVPGTVSAAGTGDPMLLVPNETAGVFRAVSLSETPAYTLQILSYYGESGLLGTKTAAKMGALIDKFDDQYANTLVLGEGDSYIPGPWLIGGADPSLNAVSGIGSTALGRPDIAIMNAFGTDASALGNHEFDLGSPVFQSAITASGSWVGAQFPFITANINTAADSSLRGISDKTLGGTSTNNFAGQETTAIKGKIAPYAISTQGGEKIGIIGITTFDLLIKSSPNGTVPKDDGNPATTDIQEVAIYVQAAVDALKLMGVNKIVMVDQLDTIERNKELAPLVSGVDIMVAGGGHERLGDANDVAVGFNGHTADFLDTFPILLNGADGKPTLLVTTDTEYTYLGRLVVDFDAAGDIIVNNLNPTINGAYASTEASLQAAYGTTQTADQIVAGSAIGAKVDAITDAIQAVIAAKDGTVWGYTNVYLEGDRAFGRAQEVNFGNISADANMFKAQAALGAGAFVTSLKNGGGLRASVGSIDEDGSKIPPAANPEVGKPAGAISTLDIENALRFDNKLMVFDTTPAGLKAIMEFAAGLPAGNGGYMQIGGIRVSFDPDNAVGSKVVNISLTDASGRIIARVVENGAVVPDAPSVISMVSLNFTANGGDGYPIKANATNFRYLLTDGTLSTAIDPTLDFTAAINLPANALGEQKAFQDFLTEFHGTPAKAYGQADTPAAQDVRIENLNARTTDVVFQGEDRSGTTGNDSVTGFAGDDTISGLSGNDSINGAAGHDSLSGGGGNDTLDGASGNDTLNGGAGNDSMLGGTGNDTYVVDSFTDAVVEFTGQGTDTVLTTVGTYTLGANVENLTYTGVGRFTGNGNALNNVITGNVNNDTLLGGAGNDTLIGGGGNDRLDGGAGSDVVVFEGTRAAATITRTAPGNWTVTTATGGTDTLIGVEEIRFGDSSLYSTSQTPYLVSTVSNVSFTSILSSGDVAGTKADGTPWRMVGVPDGLGAFDNGDGTMTVLMNQEIGNTSGVVRAHGSIGSFVSKIVIDKATLGVVSGSDLATTVYQDNDGDGVYTVGTTAWSRFCSGDLADISAFYDAASGLGSTARIYLAGEESGPEGRAFAFVATGAEAGRAYELPTMGNMSFENVLARPNSGAKTVAVMTDDATPGQVYFYIGDKQATGNAVEMAGLTNGQLFGIKAAGIGNNATSEAALNGAVPLSGSFTLEQIAGAKTMTGAQIETASDTAGVTEWWRPEDGAWDVVNPNRFYFVTTASVTGPSRLWALDFTDATNPALGGTFTALLDGTEGQKMFDNITVGTDGTLMLVEDVGGNDRLGKVWHYDPGTDTLTEVAQHDPARFTTGAPGFLTIDEEASGIIEVTSMLGDADTRAFLVDTQAHYGFGATGSADRTEIVEGGQLQVMYIETVRTGTATSNTLTGTFIGETLLGLNGNDSLMGAGGNDSLDGGAGADTLDGGIGNDSLNGGTGADSMAGGMGHDSYWLDNAADLIVELANQGTDTVFTGIGAHTLGAHIENVTYTGAGAFTGNGNALNNVITGAGGSDTLNGGDGLDTLFGMAGSDRLNGGAGADWLDGGASNDVLDGGLGADMLTGGLGNDVFRFVRGEAAGDMITDFLGNGTAAGDRLVFVGYGTAAAGASFTNMGGNDWQLRSADGTTMEMISITGSVVAQDWVFS